MNGSGSWIGGCGRDDLSDDVISQRGREGQGMRNKIFIQSFSSLGYVIVFCSSGY